MIESQPLQSHIPSHYDTGLSLTGERGITKSATKKPSSQGAHMEGLKTAIFVLQKEEGLSRETEIQPQLRM
jgi:hypothetical protein